MAPAAFTRHLIKDPESIPAKAYFNTGGFKADAPESYLAEFGAGGGLTNALGLARMYAPLAQQGTSGDKQFMSPDQVQVMAETAVRGGIDRTLMMPTHFSPGFMKTMNNLDRPGGALESLILGPSAFGHAGAGGSLGFAEPELGLSFGYVMNQMGAGILLNERGQTLVDALYQSQGYRHSRLGDYRR
jgi:CubicO group peptidase (beta-lactamase class C family)